MTHLKSKQEDKMQAVIVLDVHEDSLFEPLTLHFPRCLLPLANVPLIEYTLEWLSTSTQISDVLLIGYQRTISIVRQYLETSSKWGDFLQSSQPTAHYSLSLPSPGPFPLSSPVNTASHFPLIHFITLPNTSVSLGDAMRELDSLSLISGDFLLIRSPADIISNIDLDQILDKHRAARVADKSIIMTHVLKQLSLGHRSRDRTEHHLVVLDRASSRLISFDKLDAPSLLSQKLISKTHPELSSSRALHTALSIPIEHLKASTGLEVRYDLVDTFVDVCTPDFLAQFTENFDHQDLHEDFIKGLMGSDILSYHFAVQVLTSGYLAAASTPALFDAISRDLLQRWVFPIVPDANLFDVSDPSGYMLRRGLVYLSRSNVTLARTSSLRGHVLVGANTSVGERSLIENAVLGRDCRIGAGVIVRNSYLMDGVTLEDEVVLDGVILGKGAYIHAATTLGTGSIVSAGVEVGPAVHITTRLVLARDASQEQLEDPRGAIFLPGSRAATPEPSLDQLDTMSKTSSQRLAIPMAGLSFKDLGSSHDYMSLEPAGDVSLGSKSNAVPWTTSLARAWRAVRKDAQYDSEDSDSDSDGTEEDTEVEETLRPEALRIQLTSIGLGGRREDVQSLLSPIEGSLVDTPRRLRREAAASTESDYASEGPSSESDSDSDGDMALTYQDTAAHMPARHSPLDRHHPNADAMYHRTLSQAELSHFIHEASETLRNALQAEQTCSQIENTILEMNALKLACFADFEACRAAILPTLMQAIFHGNYSGDHAAGRGSTVNYIGRVQEVLGLWMSLIAKYVASESDQMDVLRLLLAACMHQGASAQVSAVNAGKIFQNTILLLYQKDVLEEETLLKWWNRNAEWANQNSAARSLKSFLDPLIQWLQTANEASDEEN